VSFLSWNYCEDFERNLAFLRRLGCDVAVLADVPAPRPPRRSSTRTSTGTSPLSPFFRIMSGTVRNFVCGGGECFGNVAQRCATGVARPVNSSVAAVET
jgi:hypothetical protein